MPRKTSPPILSNIPDEIRLKVLSYALNSDGNIILNNDFIKSYFQSMSNIFAINKRYKIIDNAYPCIFVIAKKAIKIKKK